MAERGQLYLRLEHNQWKFAIRRAGSYHAAIVAARHLAPYPTGHSSFGNQPDRLATAVVGAKRALVVDPDTPGLTSAGVLTYKGARRLAATAAAKAMAGSLPLGPGALRQAVLRDRLVDATMVDQRLATAVAPPYLGPRSREDPRHQLNLLMLRRVVQSAGTQVPIAFVEVTLSRLRTGLLEDIAVDYATAGAQRIFLRVRGFGETAGAEDFRRYLEAIDAFTKHDLDVVADCVGRLGPLLVHGGALGFSTGTMIYRSVAKDLLHNGDGGSSQILTVESPSRWYEVSRKSPELTEIEPCPVPECPVGRSTQLKLDDIREHRLHTYDRFAQQVLKEDTLELVQVLRQMGQPELARYATILEDRYRRAA